MDFRVVEKDGIVKFMPAEILLSRLNKVRATGEGRWTACCPAHEDAHPSLAVRETADGTVLVKCFSGCSSADVVAAVGLELGDLFPERLPALATYAERKAGREKRLGFDARAVLSALSDEILIVRVLVATLQARGWLDDDEVARLDDAARRIADASNYCERTT